MCIRDRTDVKSQVQLGDYKIDNFDRVKTSVSQSLSVLVSLSVSYSLTYRLSLTDVKSQVQLGDYKIDNFDRVKTSVSQSLCLCPVSPAVSLSLIASHTHCFEPC